MVKKYSAFLLVLISLLACERQSAFENLIQEPSCIKSQSHCQLNTKAGLLNIQFNVRYLIAEAPFELYVSVPNERYTIKRGYMEGVDMFMGKIPLFFDAHTAEEVIAESMFGSCSQDKMQWRIWLEVIDKELGETVVQTVSFTITSYRGMKALPASS